MTISGLGSKRSSRANETKPKDFHNKSAARGAYEFNDLITHTEGDTPCGMLQVARLVDTACVSGEFVKKVQESDSREIPKWNSTSQLHPRLILILIPILIHMRMGMQPACPGGIVAMRTAKVIDLVRLGEQEEVLPNAGMWSTFKCN